MTQTTETTVPFTGDLLDFAKDYAHECAARGEFPSVMHVVSDEICETGPFVFDGLTLDMLDMLVMATIAIVGRAEVRWAAFQAPVWVDITGDVAGFLTAPKPHPLVKEGLALIIVDAEGADYWTCTVERHDDAVSLVGWHETSQGPCCDANGVCS